MTTAGSTADRGPARERVLRGRARATSPRASSGASRTIDAKGRPHVVPLGWSYNDERDTIDIGGRNNEASRKYHHVQANPNVGFAIDDVLPPWRPRCVDDPRDRRGRRRPARRRRSRARSSASPRPQVTSWGLEES